MEKYNQILNRKKELKIRINSNFFNINFNSLKKILSLISNNEEIENYILFINEHLDNINRDEKKINNLVFNEIGTTYNENLKKIKRKVESDPIILFIDYYIPYLYFLIGSLLLFHLFLFLFGPDVREKFIYFLV